ncbi:hypothetical protein FY557_17935 [Chryseobacterium sp. SN22]|uniref:hypothetical protein n=1 Tax=Chryseobacterium sp. SN22 TaxID=2606431 RepID=UPI0011EE9718|nr:hypothetical protein [Chryseobacterium sp. SN22]KAA0126313.1 hypothetical protein FY557_17935 [Chryseobacterium sp. SN22]
MNIISRNAEYGNSRNKSCIFSGLLLLLIFPHVYFAQTRVIVNPGLEFGIAPGGYGQYDANFGFGATFDAGAAITSPWYTSHPTQANACEPGFSGACHPIEIWGTGFQSVPAAQGSNFVELNAFVSSMIYQNMYLANGDIISFNFRHRARSTTAEQSAMVIEDQNQNNIATVRSTTVPSSTSAWSSNQGTYTFTGTSGVYRVGFRAVVDGGSPGAGNLLDDIRITLNPLIDLKFSNALSSCEGSSNGTLFLRINGAVTSPTTVAVQLIDPANGTALATDADIALSPVANSNGTPVITHTAGSSIYLISVPQGNYDGGVTPGYSSPNNDEDGIAVNIASVNDALYEPDETFKFEIKQQGTNGSTNNFVSTSSPIFGDTYYPTTNDYFIRRCVCYDDANTSAAGTDSKIGITLLKRAGTDDGNWPMIRKSAHVVLESNTKGLVITRLSTPQINAIVSPQEGMMVYDITAKCLKLYDGTAWSCFSTPACP